MPTLFFGPHKTDDGPSLYSAELRPIETSIFDQFKLSDLGPADCKPNEAIIWHLMGHTALAWYDKACYYHVIYLVGELDERYTLIKAREAFPTKVPGPMLFRIANSGEIYER